MELISESIGFIIGLGIVLWPVFCIVVLVWHVLFGKDDRGL